MREWELEKCDGCCARGQSAFGASALAAARAGLREAFFLEELTGEGASGAPRARSGLAYASGYAGVAYIFGCSLSPLAFGAPGLSAGAAVTLLLLWGLWAPLAVVLAYAAAVSLDRSRAKSGRLPALFGLFVGLYGSCQTALAAYVLARYLRIF